MGILLEMLVFALCINISLMPIVVVCYIMESHRYALAQMIEKRRLVSEMKGASEEVLHLADTVLHQEE
jgi:hypothetical protein